MFKILYAVFMGFWRDSFGKSGWDLPVYKYRIFQHVVAFFATFMLCFISKALDWYWALWIATWIQIEWAIGHGPCFDVGTSGKPDKKLINRYEKMVGYKLLCKIFPENEWYDFGFDFILLAIRYTYPLIPICVFFNPVFLTLGLGIAGLYAMYRYCAFFRNQRFCDVEIWAGFLLGLYVSFL